MQNRAYNLPRVHRFFLNRYYLEQYVVNKGFEYVDDLNKGLLCMPSAEFEEDATFMITNNFLNRAYLPQVKGYEWDKRGTFEYSFDVTLWGRLEIAYICTLIDSHSQREGVHTINQDRHFAARVAITKDGEWNQKWLPAIAIGLSDPVTGSGGDYIDDNVGATGNGFFNRYYISASKRFATSWGDVSGHVGFQYSRRKDGMPTGPQVAVTWNPVWLNNPEWFMNSFRATLEYDARYVNFGINASIWKDRFEFMAMLLNMRYPMVGARFKLALPN